MNKKYQVFISSTFSDLKEERMIIIQSLLNAGYIPSGMELFTATNMDQFEYIKKIIDLCDYYVIVVAGRYGSINGTTGLSYTEMEHDYALEKGIPILAFIHSNPMDLPAKKRDDVNQKKLHSFTVKLKKNKLCRLWQDKSTLISEVINSLNCEIIHSPRPGWTRNISNNIKENVKANSIKDVTTAINLSQISFIKSRIIGNLSTFDFFGNPLDSQRRLEEPILLKSIFMEVAPYIMIQQTVAYFNEIVLSAINRVSKSPFYSIDEDTFMRLRFDLEVNGLVNIKRRQVNIDYIVVSMKGKEFARDNI